MHAFPCPSRICAPSGRAPRPQGRTRGATRALAGRPSSWNDVGVRARSQVATSGLAVALLVQCGARHSTRPETGLAVGASPPSGPAAAVLFIGNSLTEANDLPRRVQEISRDAG